MTVDDWEALFLKSWQKEFSRCKPLSVTADSWPGYSLGNCLNANVSMLLATGKVIYLDRALLYINNRIASAKPSSSFPYSQYKDDFLTWVNHSHHELGDDGREYALFESCLWRYVAHLLRLMRETNSIYKVSSYRKQYDKILEFTEKHIFQKWYTRGTIHIYRTRTHMASHWAYIALELSRITDDQNSEKLYKEIYEKISSQGFGVNDYSLKNQFVIKGSTPRVYFWNSVWGSYDNPGQDVSHGNHVVSFIVEAHALQTEWITEELTLLKGTFNTKIWPQNTTHAGYVDGTGEDVGWYSDGFVKLGRFDKDLQLRLEQHKASKTNWDTQFLGNCALNAKILLFPQKEWSQIFSLDKPKELTFPKSKHK